ncbi:alpha/beta-hydrolase [Periconia macrospinosa]|uniref:Alpha/beta-hydrolase n=1 Tax=Periconia macrospinosa TaxID=97972 RepID=A0A2V1DVW7_9PLEO|nr:alpha/beta-hydrolase [Periconia macrospinosa]
MSKPTIVCVPGAWHSPEIYAKTLSILREQHGYPTIGLPLASAGAYPPHMSFDEDVKVIRDCLTKLVVEEEKEVILVTHSYTGMPGAEAPVGLGKKDREAVNKKGGVIRLVFIMAFAMPEGFTPTSGGAQFPDWMKVDMENGVATVAPEDAKSIFYHDISSEEGDLWASKLSHQSLGVYTSTTSYAAWRYIPSTYVIGTEDKSNFTPEVVSFIIETAKKIEPTAFDVVERCDGGHCLMISRPEWLADVLRRAAGEIV